MKDRRCPECGYRANSNRCPICDTRIPFGAVSEDTRSKPAPQQAKPYTAPQQTKTYTAPQQTKPYTAPQQTKTPSKNTPGSKLRRVVLIIVLAWALCFLVPVLFALVSVWDDVSDVFSDSFGDFEYDDFEYEYIEEFAFLPAGSPGAEDVPAIKPVELYNQDGICVTADALGSYSEYDYAVQLTIANDTDQNITLSVDDLYVNDYSLILSGLYCEVEAGETVEDYIQLQSDELAEAGIDTIADIAFSLNIYDSEDYTDICMLDLITLDTSVEDDFVQPVDDSGMELYNRDGVRVIFREMTVGEYDASFCYFIENTTDRELIIESEDISVNGQLTDDYLWSILQPGTRCIDCVYFFDFEDRDIFSIEDVQELSFVLSVRDAETYQITATSDLITVDPTQQ